MRGKFTPKRRLKSNSFVAIVALAFAFALSAAVVYAQAVLDSSEVAKLLAIENLQISSTGVSCTIVNRSPHIVRDVEILVQYHWLWDNEFKPGANPPGETAAVRLQGELKPGQSVPFSHALTSPSNRKDGRFLPEVTVGGFTVVVPPK